jgi:hypothetical protein
MFNDAGLLFCNMFRNPNSSRMLRSVLAWISAAILPSLGSIVSLSRGSSQEGKSFLRMNRRAYRALQSAFSNSVALCFLHGLHVLCDLSMAVRRKLTSKQRPILKTLV